MSSNNLDAEDAIANGCRHYGAKEYKPALQQFTIAMKLCPCNRNMKRERCSCKDFQKVASQNDSIFKEAMYNCHCSVGKTFNKCGNVVHIQALDYRAATFEALQQLERAKKDAEWILELAPRFPDGYLRLGKIARLMKNNEFAWKLFKEGIDVASANGITTSPKVKQLYAACKPLQLQFYRKDPLLLPADVLYWILTYCDLVTRVRCLRLSHSWNKTLTATVNAWLWKQLEFTGRAAPRTPPRTDGLRKLVNYAGRDVRRISIPFAYSFGLMQSKFNVLLSGARNLEHLEIGFPITGLEIPRYAGMCKTLKSLKLSHFNPLAAEKHSEHDVIVQFPYSFIHNAADVLEHIHLNGLPSDWFRRRGLPSLPQLKTLRLQMKSKGTQTLPLFYVAEKTPALEHLWLNETWVEPEPTWNEHWDSVWANLKSLTIVADNALLPEYMFGVIVLTSLNAGRTLRHIDLSFSSRHEGISLISTRPVAEMRRLDRTRVPTDATELRQLNCYEKIDLVRLHCLPLNPFDARDMFEPAVQEGRLRNMDLVFPLDVLNSSMGASSISYLEGYEWLKGAESIRSMGVSRFRFRSYPRTEADLPLPSFLASFPNLEVLEIGSIYYEEAELRMVIEAVLKVTKLKKLYQCQVTGTIMDHLAALGERYGVEMIWGERSRPWPVVLE